MGYRIVVAGATGNVGREVVNILAERNAAVQHIAADDDGLALNPSLAAHDGQ